MIDNSLPKAGEIWHPYWVLEEVQANMWGTVTNRKTWLDIAILFTGNHVLYGEYMQKVVNEWKYSCEHNLSKQGDKRAWIGHAAVAYAIKCPEDIVREAWSFLTKDQQEKANMKALEAINLWRDKND